MLLVEFRDVPMAWHASAISPDLLENGCHRLVGFTEFSPGGAILVCVLALTTAYENSLLLQPHIRVTASQCRVLNLITAFDSADLMALGKLGEGINRGGFNSWDNIYSDCLFQLFPPTHSRKTCMSCDDTQLITMWRCPTDWKEWKARVLAWFLKKSGNRTGSLSSNYVRAPRAIKESPTDQVIHIVQLTF